MHRRRFILDFSFKMVIFLLLSTLGCSRLLADEPIDLSKAVIVTSSNATLVEKTAATVLQEEWAKRAGITIPILSKWPNHGWVVALTTASSRGNGVVDIPALTRRQKPEGFAILSDRSNSDRPILWIVGADPRGTLFGAGKLLRSAECRSNSILIKSSIDQITSPDYPIRGHQLGYRATANSYDAWSPEQFDQYIRELAIFGSNSVEGIPFHDKNPTVNFYPRDKMNVDISRICKKYGQDYWLWVPADFDLKDNNKRTRFLEQHAELFKACPTLTGVFVAGGDPGDNPAELVIPYLADLAKILSKQHPEARVWLSMQGYFPNKQDVVYKWLETEKPKWFGGIVAGPASPALPDLKVRLPNGTPIRDYPDITHSVRCQFAVPYWDPAFAFTIGRECVNPRPEFFSRVIHDTAPYTNGFISYSDGIHDDVNKIIWSSLEWNMNTSTVSILEDYCRFFFGPDLTAPASAGIAAFEKNWQGSLATNGSVDATYALWNILESKYPQLRSNWRWQLCQLRANYDMYIRHRLIFEQRLELAANSNLLRAKEIGSNKAIEFARSELDRAVQEQILPDVLNRITSLCDELYRSIGLQSSVTKYHASGPERGAVLDFVNYPLNNRWWLEDEFAKVAKLPEETARHQRLVEIAKWESPGQGSYYDDIGNVAKSPHEVRNELLAAPLLDLDNLAMPGVMWWNGNNSLARARQSWFTDEAWPVALKYPPVNPESEYEIRTTGYGDCLLRVNGHRVWPIADGRNIGDVKIFPLPHGFYKDGKIIVTFDPTFEPLLNWRQQSRLTEIWLIKK